MQEPELLTIVNTNMKSTYRNIIIAAGVALTSGGAFAVDLADNPLNHAAGALNNVLLGLLGGGERTLQAIDKAMLRVEVIGSGEMFFLQAFNGRRQQFSATQNDVEYVFRAGLASAAVKACSGRDYRFTESSPRATFVWQKWLAENSPFDYSNIEQRTVVMSTGPDFSLVWHIECGQPGGWHYPGERALAIPISAYIKLQESLVKGMSPLHRQEGNITVHIPSGEFLRKVYAHDLTTQEGHLGLFQQRLLGASVIARLRQSGAFNVVDVKEYNDSSEVGNTEGLYVAAKPFTFSLVGRDGLPRGWNPKTQWQQYMPVPVNSYANAMLSFGDAGARFAVSASSAP